jgi:DNA-binding NarL/FixJ family response regulator
MRGATLDLSRQNMSITVSIVEDDAQLRESISRFIDGAPGFTCAGSYSSGEDALDGILLKKPAVALMDINLPGMSGIECVRKLKERAPALQVIMLTVYENSDRIFEALAAGACGYLIKRTPPDKLLEAVREISAGGSPMSSNIARKVVQAFQPSSGAESKLVEHLAPREQQVLDLLSKGRAYKQIAGEMNLHMGTVRTYVRRIYEKLHVNCRTEAVVKYLNSNGPRGR